MIEPQSQFTGLAIGLMISTFIFMVSTVVFVLLYFFKSEEPTPQPIPGPDPGPDPGPAPVPTPGKVCPGPGPGPSPEGGVPIGTQPSGTVQIVNLTSQNPLRVSLQIKVPRNPPPDPKIPNPPPPPPLGPIPEWTKVGGTGTLGPLIENSDQNPPDYQLVTLAPNEHIIVTMPDQNNFRITPWNPKKGGMPILIECGKDVVCNASAVDGLNYLMRMELTTGGSTPTSVIDVNTSPCPPGTPCRNPSVDGIFKPGTTWESKPCRAGTCNLAGASVDYCDKLHTGQCADTCDTWNSNQRAKRCIANNAYTIYCYSHDDQTSSPPLVAPHKVKTTYRDLP